MAYSIRDVITVELLKKTMLVGINLTDDDGNDYPDELFDEAIDQAISLMEEELEITIDNFKVKKERHDLYSEQVAAWYSNQLDRRPVKTVDNLQISYGNYSPVQIPDAWINLLEPQTGSVSLIPTAESIGTFSFKNVLPLLMDPMAGFSKYSRVPGYFSYDYSAGFNFIEKEVVITAGNTESSTIEFGETIVDKPRFTFELFNNDTNLPISGVTAEQINVSSEDFQVEIDSTLAFDCKIVIKINSLPPLLTKAILYTAAMLPLDTAGDLLLGAGIAQQNISIDGLSQSIASTASATSAGFGARIISYRDQLKTSMIALKRKYRASPKIATF